MKEKVIVALSIAGFFGIMALSTKMNNNTLNTKVSTTDSSVLIKEIPQQDSDDIYPEIDHIEDNAMSSKNTNDELSNCHHDSIITDGYTFGDAFKYYRQCLGKDNNFQWNGKSYSTLLIEEIIIQVADSIESKENLDKNNTISATQ